MGGEAEAERNGGLWQRAGRTGRRVSGEKPDERRLQPSNSEPLRDDPPPHTDDHTTTVPIADRFLGESVICACARAQSINTIAPSGIVFHILVDHVGCCICVPSDSRKRNRKSVSQAWLTAFAGRRSAAENTREREHIPTRSAHPPLLPGSRARRRRRRGPPRPPPPAAFPSALRCVLALCVRRACDATRREPRSVGGVQNAYTSDHRSLVSPVRESSHSSASVVPHPPPAVPCSSLPSFPPRFAFPLLSFSIASSWATAVVARSSRPRSSSVASKRLPTTRGWRRI